MTDTTKTAAKKPVKAVGRAKPLIEQEADRQAREAQRAKEAARAERLQRETPEAEARPLLPPKEIIITEKGEGRVHTGEIDPATNRPSFYAKGEKMKVDGNIAYDLEQRGYAAILGDG